MMNKKEKKCRTSNCGVSIGGQAVLEGIMMKNGIQYAVAVRKPNQEIEVKVDEYPGAGYGKKFFNLPFIRGIFRFIDSMVLGIKTLTYSAEFYDEEEPEKKDAPGEKEVSAEQPEEPKKGFLERMLGDKAESFIMGVTVFISVVISVALFMMLPLFISELLQKYVPFIKDSYVPVIEAVVKIALFILYIVLISKMKDIQRTFMYHGAEHKCINCIEHGMELNVENVLKSSRYHKRCGTSFLLIVMIISIVFFIFIRSENVWLRYGIRLLLIPVIAGISYEVIRLAGRSDSLLVKIVSAPGLGLQRFTTKEPDAQMAEVAIAAVEAVFDWKSYLAEQETKETDE